MTNRTKGRILKVCAVAIDVGVPLGVTLMQFPVWVDKSAEATLSGLFVVFAFLSLLPLWKYVRKYLSSPSIWLTWVMLWLLTVALRRIIDEMIIVMAAGAIANIVGWCIFKMGQVIEKKP